MSTAGRFYITGGTLPQEAPSYVARAADRELLEGLRAGEYCAVLNARQMGKSSLAVRTVAQLTASGVRTVYVDLQRLGGANVTPEQWYLGLLVEIGRGLGLREEFLDYWREHREFSLIQRVLGAVREVALERYPQPVVIFLDEIDTLRGLSFSTDELFGALRECYNHRVQDPVYGRLVFCLVGSALPSDLVRDPRTSPFNVGERIELRDFTLEELRPFAEGLDRPDAVALLRSVYHWTRGHPYLTQSLCAEIAGDPAVRRPRDVDRAVARLFFDPKARERNVNLADVANRMLGSVAEGQTPEEHRAAILDLYAQVRRGKKVVDDEADRRVAVLKMSGITRTVEGCLQVRNRIYARAFDRKWIAEQLPDAEVRRQRAAYRRGVLRTAAIGCVVVAIIAGLAWKARQSAQESRQRLARSYTANGMRLAEEGDPAGALPWLVEAIRLDQGRPAQERTDRLRFAMTLRKCVKPVYIWSHSGGVNAVDISPDSRLVVTGSDDKTARVWEIATGKSVGAPMRHQGPVKAAVFSPDGRRIATASDDKTAQVWDTRTGQPVTPPLRHEGGVRCVVFSPDGQWVATASEDWTARIWDAATGRPMTPSLRLGGTGNSVESSRDESRLLTASGGGARVWDVRTGRAVTGALCASAWHAEFSPDGRSVVTASSDGTARVWEARTGQPLTPPLRHSGDVKYAAFSPDGRSVVTASGGTARVWDAHTGQPLTPPLRHSLAVKHVAFSPDGLLVLTASWDGTARVWDAETGEPRTPPLWHFSYAQQARFSQDGRWVVTASLDGTARLWDLAVVPYAREIPVRSRIVLSAEFSPDGGRLLISSGDVGVQVREARTGQPITPPMPGGGIFSPDGRRVATTSGGAVSIWEASTGRLLLRLRHPRTPHLDWGGSDFSPDGRWLVTFCEDEIFRLWDAHTGKLLSPVWMRSGEVQRAAFSRDWKRVATSGRDGSVKVWEVSSGHQILRLAPHKGMEVAALSPDGRQVVTAAVTELLQVWDVATGRPVGSPIAPRTGACRAAFSPDGRRLSTLSEQWSVQIWEASTGHPVTPILKTRGASNTLYFSPDGQYLATASGNGTARVWDASTAEPVSPLLEHGAVVCDAQFSPDGHWLATASCDGYARIWELRPEERALSHLESLARILAGSRIDPVAGSVEIEQQQFQADWQVLRTHSPADFVASPQQVVAWQLHELGVYENTGRWSLAAALRDRLKADHPTNPDLFGRLHSPYAELGQWDRASADYARAIALSKVADPWLWEHLAMAQLEGGDLAGYRKTCADMLARFGKDEDVFPRVAATCTRGPNALPYLGRLVQLAREAAARHPKEPERAAVVAAALYRAGRYQEALQEFTRGLATSRESVGDSEKLLLAMCRARLGHSAEARSVLASLPKRYSDTWDVHPGWQAQRREAEAVVGRGR